VVKAVLGLAAIEVFKLRRERLTRLALTMLVVTPIGVELLLSKAYPSDAVLPRSAHVLLSGGVLLPIALIPTVVSVIALGRDYQLGVARALLSRGVKRHQFVLSKVLVTTAVCVVGGLAHASAALLATCVGHAVLSDVPLAQVAGADLLRRALAAALVSGLAGLALAGVVNMALVAGRNSWVGVLAGIGCFLGDSMMYGSANPAGRIYQYSLTYHAGSLLEHLAGCPSGEAPSQPLATYGLAEPGQSLAWLLLLGCGFTLAAILLFRRQDLTEAA
jgi:ABC-type transport system involved in multi-copper enzyme maturation permease subunit